MEPSFSSIETLVKEIKKVMFSSSTSTISPSPISAYETAWLAMIPQDLHERKAPKFKAYLDWILNNQNDKGFWGEEDDEFNPTIDALPATLACVIALKLWGVGDAHIIRGLDFINGGTEIILKAKQRYSHLPRGFVLLFPSMIEHAQNAGLEISFPGVVQDIFLERQQILNSVERNDYSRMLPYFEAFSKSSYDHVDAEIIKSHLRCDGSLYMSPSATTQAFLATGDQRCLKYLLSLVKNFPNGVPPLYPVNEDLVKLCVVDQIQRLGLAEYFDQEIEQILAVAHRNYKEKSRNSRKNDPFLSMNLYMDSLAFRLLRMHGYDVTPLNFCWFLDDEQVMARIENESGNFLSAILNIYRATDLMFDGETDLEEVKAFSTKILQKNMSRPENVDDSVVVLPNFLKMVKHELNMPWIARLEHLDHRFWIEESKSHPLWVAKSCSFYRLPWLHDEKLIRLAEENYKFKQSIYRKELEEVGIWCKMSGLSNLGFGREKTTYCYFAVSSSATTLPHNSIVRILITKIAVLITCADDFFDMKGSLHELQCLNDAVNIWDGEGLDGHGKIIFDALDSLVNDISDEYYDRYKIDILKAIRDLWRETFDSWMVETSWSKNDYLPTKEECLQLGMISIAVHTIVLIASCFMNPRIPEHKLRPFEYENITKLLMTVTRMLNDTQSYQKEQLDGKKNLVFLHMKENPNADIECIVGNIKEIVEKKKRQLVEHALIDGLNDLPKSSNYLHLQCLKVFQMLFSHANNRFDSESELVPDIMKAIFVPIQPSRLKNVTKSTINSSYLDANLVTSLPRMLPKPRFKQSTISNIAFKGGVVQSKFGICFI